MFDVQCSMLDVHLLISICGSLCGVVANLIDKISYRIFIFLLIFSPLAFGTVSTWSLTIMEALSIGAVLLLLISCGLNDRPIYKAPGALLITALYSLYSNSTDSPSCRSC